MRVEAGFCTYRYLIEVFVWIVLIAEGIRMRVDFQIRHNTIEILLSEFQL